MTSKVSCRLTSLSPLEAEAIIRLDGIHGNPTAFGVTANPHVYHATFASSAQFPGGIRFKFDHAYYFDDELTGPHNPLQGFRCPELVRALQLDRLTDMDSCFYLGSFYLPDDPAEGPAEFEVASDTDCLSDEFCYAVHPSLLIAHRRRYHDADYRAKSNIRPWRKLPPTASYPATLYAASASIGKDLCYEFLVVDQIQEPSWQDLFCDAVHAYVHERQAAAAEHHAMVTAAASNFATNRALELTLACRRFNRRLSDLRTQYTDPELVPLSVDYRQGCLLRNEPDPDQQTPTTFDIGEAELYITRYEQVSRMCQEHRQQFIDHRPDVEALYGILDTSHLGYASVFFPRDSFAPDEDFWAEQRFSYTQTGFKAFCEFVSARQTATAATKTFLGTPRPT